MLVILARIIEENTRSVDLACRLGGDEILLLLPEMNRKQAMDKAELIADLFKSQCRQQFGGDSVTFSLSSGVACCPDDGSTISELVARSDHYLYSAKHRGKNQIAAG